MKFSLLTYNTYFNKGVSDIWRIVKERSVDVICLQEFEMNPHNLSFLEKYGYKLAHYSNSFIKHGRVYGVVTYYNPSVFKVEKAVSLTLPRSIYEMILVIIRGGNKPRTVVETRLIFKKSSSSVTVYNLHLSYLGSNGSRIRQINTTFSSMKENKESIIVTGDFNFPYGRKRLEKIVKRYGFKEATDNLFFTFMRKVAKLFSLKLKLDYVLFKNLKHLRTSRLRYMHSDHFPILVEFEVP